MRKNLRGSISLLLLLFFAATAAWADSKIKGKYTAGGQTTEGTIYTKGVRQRFEYGGEVAMVNQCDLKRMIQINDKTKSYLVTPTDQNLGTVAAPASPAQPTALAQGQPGVVTITTTINDSGERKKLFGYEARHVKSTLIRAPSPEACDQKKERIETDGWYIDFDQNFVCPIGQNGTSGQPNAKTECGDEIRNNVDGKGNLGYPLMYTMSTYDQNGQVSQSVTMEVLEFSAAPLEAALFDAPAGYNEMKSYQEFASLASSASTGHPGAGGELSSRLAEPKKPGAIRIGVADVNTKAGRPAATAPLKDQLTGFILNAKYDAVPLVAKTPEEIGTEAQQKQCDYVLHTDITEVKKAGGKFGGMLTKVSAMSSGGKPGEPPKEKHEVKVDYKLFPVGSDSPKLASTVIGKTGGGFNWHTAMSLASTASSFAMMSKGFMGFNPQMMSMFGGMGGGGGMGSALMHFDPAMSGMMSMMHTAQSAKSLTPQGNPGENDAIADALGNVVKAVTSGLQKK